MLGTSCSATQLLPALDLMASHTVCSGMPALAPSIKPSPMAAALTNQSKLVSNLIVAPLPGAPTWKIFSPMTSNKAWCCSKRVCSPPTKMDKRPKAAMSTALVTGASKKPRPLLCAKTTSSCTNSTALVEVSMMVAPRLAWASTPCSPSITSRTCGGPGKEAITTSAWVHPAAMLSAQTAPWATRFCALSGLMSCTVSA